MTKIWNAGDEITHDDLNETGMGLHARPQDTPNLTLKIGPGVAVINGSVVKYAGGNSPSFTAPSSNPRIDLLTLDSSGTIARTAGTEAGSPAAPAYPVDKIVICEVYNKVGQTQIFRDDQGSGKGYILRDSRAFVLGATAIDHSTGSSDAGKQIKTDANGLLDSTFLPAVSGDRSYSFLAGAAITAGQPVYMRTTAGSTTNTQQQQTDVSGASLDPQTATAQSIKAPNRISALKGVKIWCSKTYPTTGGNIKVAIQADSAGSPSGSDLVSKTLSNDTLSQTPGFVEFDFASPYALTPNTTYWIVVSDDSGPGYVYIYGSTTSVYADGTMKRNSSGWVDQNRDMAFQLIEVPPPGSIEPTSASASGTCATFVGFAKGAASAFQSVAVQVGGIIASLSGLSPGNIYYAANTAGAIATSAGTTTKKVGLALSATEMLITPNI